MQYCHFGCGQPATYQFKNHNWCCSRYPSQCPEIGGKIRSGKAAVPLTQRLSSFAKQKATKNSYTSEQKDRISLRVMTTVVSRAGYDPSILSEIELREKYGRTKADWFVNKPISEQIAISAHRKVVSETNWQNSTVRDRRLTGMKKYHASITNEARSAHAMKAIITKLVNSGVDVDQLDLAEISNAFGDYQREHVWLPMAKETRDVKLANLHDGCRKWWAALPIEVRDRHIKRTKFNRMKLKPYQLPSERVIFVQGYEHHALDKLFSHGELETNITAGQDVNLIIPYDDSGTLRLYYPDILVGTTKIIEVKSPYTYGFAIDQIEAKRQSCLALGFTFELWLIQIKRKTPIITIS